MINIDQLNRIKNEMDRFEKERENVIFLSRAVLRSSKHAIYSVHRGDFSRAKKLIDEAEKNIKIAENLFKKDSDLRNIGAYSEGLEEYAEAKCFYGFVKNKKIPGLNELKVNSEEYLLGLCDFTGELARRAVILATARKINDVKKIRDISDEIYGFFSSLDMRNSELRKKADAIKWNLKRVEDILYDVSLKR